uniref:Uncharacterized protein n=1 Tax=Arundo donax TaxID=35708 RepID=A0A0A8YKL0_ARUDO
MPLLVHFRGFLDLQLIRLELAIHLTKANQVMVLNHFNLALVDPTLVNHFIIASVRGCLTKPQQPVYGSLPSKL